MATIKYQDFLESISSKIDGTGKETAKLFLEELKNYFVSNLNVGDKVVVPSFGTFEKKLRPARFGRNPKTGEEIQISESVQVTFSSAKGFKDSLNS